MGYVDLYLDLEIAGPATPADVYSTDHLISDYLEAQVGETQTISVVAPNTTVQAAIRAVINAAGQAAVGTDLNGTGHFVDRARPAGTRTDVVASGVTIGVEPFTLPDMDGAWGIVTGGEDNTIIPGSQRQLDIEFTVLAEFDEYSSNSDFKTDLEVSVP